MRKAVRIVALIALCASSIFASGCAVSLFSKDCTNIEQRLNTLESRVAALEQQK